MAIPRPTIYRVFIVVAVSATTVAFHYGLFVGPSYNASDLFHAIHGRLCYIPIILGAIWFGVRGGLAVSLSISVATIPYAMYGIHAQHSGAVSEYTEMFFYVFIGLTAGILIELQRRERRRREALALELARKKHLASLGEMAAGLAHEIKNPLGSIRGSAEILGDDFPEGSPKHELVTVLSKETDRLNRVVEDFLNFARPRPIERAPVNINTLLERTISQIEADSRAQNVRIARRFDPAIPSAPFDAAKLHQVFLNICLNAVAAMPDGGSLTVNTRARARDGRREVVASFADQGKGIAPQDVDRIFDPFFTRSNNGTGLGLSISHTIVENHGGRIDVAPIKDGGTRISVVLPIVEEP
ncbi:MAG: ATP-binding protein [bacterium]